jgi:hypothetical protein
MKLECCDSTNVPTWLDPCQGCSDAYCTDVDEEASAEINKQYVGRRAWFYAELTALAYSTRRIKVETSSELILEPPRKRERGEVGSRDWGKLAEVIEVKSGRGRSCGQGGFMITEQTPKFKSGPFGTGFQYVHCFNLTLNPISFFHD